MTALKNIAAKGTVGALIAIALVGTLCFLAIRGDLDGPTFLTVALLPVAYHFGKNGSEKPTA